MDRKEYDNNSKDLSRELSDSDSGIYADKESAREDLNGIFSNRFSNINLLYSSEHGGTEIHAATRYGKRFVLKGLRSEYRDDPVCNICMAKEFEIGMTLDHPNIRRTVGFENVDTLGKRIILEYIDGVTLSDMISERSLAPERATAVARQIADALRYLHGKQICHRDLKPENILIPYKGDNVKIIDFNLSDSDDYIILKNRAGSKKYMAPELSDHGSKPTPETDFYSLGVVMKELSEASGNLWLAKVAERCMDTDPQKRWEGIAMLENDPEASESDSWTERILSSKILTYILSAICVLLAIFITLHYW
ncbi:MAG: serine/threonine protein kinase [Muribaculaceae bacterium]|nr:serine/threonine protein kinase [Muribaculaceae bacterium]